MKTTQQTTPTSHEQTDAKAEVIKLGLDIHKNQYVVVQQADGQAPRSPQRFKPDAFLQWVSKLREEGRRGQSKFSENGKGSVQVFMIFN